MSMRPTRPVHASPGTSRDRSRSSRHDEVPPAGAPTVRNHRRRFRRRACFFLLACPPTSTQSVAFPRTVSGLHVGGPGRVGWSCAPTVSCGSTASWDVWTTGGKRNDPEHPSFVPPSTGSLRTPVSGIQTDVGSAAANAFHRPMDCLWHLPARAGPAGSGGRFVRRPRMWMQVGVWPPTQAQRPTSPQTQPPARPWSVTGVIVSIALGATMGSIATHVLLRQLRSLFS